jgi:hypothetical protein
MTRDALAAVELGFVERLPPSASQLQWMLHVGDSVASINSARGNVPLASQNQRPDWVSKPGFLAMGSLRAFPHAQLHRLAQALAERDLPLARPEVHTLVLQALWHLGSLQPGLGSEGTGLGQAWRKDWLEPGNTAATLCHELERLAEELEQKPRGHDSVLLLGALAA